MYLTAFLDSLSYKKSSKYRIRILGIVKNPQFSYWYNPTPHPPHFLGSLCWVHVTNNMLSCLRKAPPIIISNFCQRLAIALPSRTAHHCAKKEILFSFGQCQRKTSSFSIKPIQMRSSAFTNKQEGSELATNLYLH